MYINNTTNMNTIKVYKWITYILLIPTFFIALFSLFGILFAMLNPQILIPVFIMVCIVLYNISSFIFLRKSLINNLICKKIIKDLIKVNAIAAIIFSVLNLFQFIKIIFNKTAIETAVQDIYTQNQGNISSIFSKAQITNLFWVTTIVVAIYSILLLFHIFLSFKLIKSHADSFLKD